MFKILRLNSEHKVKYSGEGVAHEYAYDIDDCLVHHLEANQKGKYFDSRGNKMILKAKDSVYKIPHFSYTSEYRHDRTETNDTHIEAINNIFRDGYVIVENIKIVPYNIIIEKKTIPNSNLIPDLTFYDKDDNIVCIIEVVVTHKCELPKINELKKKNILTFELFYNEGGEKYTDYHCFGSKELDEQDRTESERNKAIRDRIQKASEFIKMEGEKHRESTRDYYRAKKEINRIKDDISYFRERIGILSEPDYDKNNDDYRVLSRRETSIGFVYSSRKITDVFDDKLSE